MSVAGVVPGGEIEIVAEAAAATAAAAGVRR